MDIGQYGESCSALREHFVVFQEKGGGRPAAYAVTERGDSSSSLVIFTLYWAGMGERGIAVRP